MICVICKVGIGAENCLQESPRRCDLRTSDLAFHFFTEQEINHPSSSALFTPKLSLL